MKLPTIFHNIEDRSRLRSQKKAERMSMFMFKSFWAMADNLLFTEDLELGVLLGAHGHLDHCGLLNHLICRVGHCRVDLINTAAASLINEGSTIQGRIHIGKIIREKFRGGVGLGFRFAD